MKQTPLSRRSFVKVCASTVATVSANPQRLSAADGEQKIAEYERVQIVDEHGQAISCDSLPVGETFVFHYPYVTTPCFLINLGKRVPGGEKLKAGDGSEYVWPGGSGDKQSVVAFAAICAHKLSYPTRTVSFINYRHEDTGFLNAEREVENRSQVIFCCSERSVYDPTKGASVMGGPAEQPLTSILLEDVNQQDSSNCLYATGTVGTELFERFFASFEFQLALDHKVTNVRERAAGATRLYTMSEYSKATKMC